jgi:hypothetical protein
VSTLPDPPNGHKLWSIVTLAEFLSVSPAAIDALTVDAATSADDSPDFHSARPHHFYEAPGMTLGDVWLHPEAAERIAADPTVGAGMLARAVLGDDPEMAALLGWDQVYALARHVVTHGGSAG